MEKVFKEIKDRELRDMKLKIRKEIEELFLKPITVSINDMDKFEEKETMKKITFAKTFGTTGY